MRMYSKTVPAVRISVTLNPRHEFHYRYPKVEIAAAVPTVFPPTFPNIQNETDFITAQQPHHVLVSDRSSNLHYYCCTAVLLNPYSTTNEEGVNTKRRLPGKLPTSWF